jgi:hypothetical protein
MSNSKCKHCPTADHGTVICDCGHSHNVHVFGDGCTICDCERYSQVKQVYAFPPVDIGGGKQFYSRDGHCGVEPIE